MIVSEYKDVYACVKERVLLYNVGMCLCVLSKSLLFKDLHNYFVQSVMWLYSSLLQCTLT